MEGVEALGIGNVGVGTSTDEQVNDIEMTIARGPLQGGGFEISTEGINLSAMV